MGELSFCLLSTFYPPAGFGGDAVHVQRLAHGLADRGHRVRVVHNSSAYRLLGGGIGTPEPTHAGVEVVDVAVGRASTVGTYLSGRPVGYRRRLAALVAGFDVVHLHNPSLLGGPDALGLGSGVRLYTTHEHWLLCPTHVLFRNDREVCTRRTCISCTIQHRRPPQPWRATSTLGAAVAKVDALLCPSRFTAELHGRHFPGARIEVVPLAVPMPHRADPRPTGPADRPTFLYAGRLEPIKGVDRLVKAFASVRGARLVVAGEGSLRAALEDTAKENPDVTFLGRRSSSEVLALCEQATAVVVPSAGYETFGGVAIEAMSVGTPVAVRALGPLPELVSEGGGLTFDDDVSMVAVLQQLADDHDLRSRLAAEAFAVARSRYREERFFARYFELIADVADTRGRTTLAASATGAASREQIP